MVVAVAQEAVQTERKADMQAVVVMGAGVTAAVAAEEAVRGVEELEEAEREAGGQAVGDTEARQGTAAAP